MKYLRTIWFVCEIFGFSEAWELLRMLFKGCIGFEFG